MRTKLLLITACVAAVAMPVGVAAATQTRGWTATGSMVTARAFQIATRLDDGRVLVAGGFDVGGHAGPPWENQAELYDPQTEAWTATAPMSTPRAAHAAVKLKDGRVLVVGGETFGGVFVNTAEIFDPQSETWTPAAPMFVPREEPIARLLEDGRVLVAGGTTFGGTTNDSELYDPATNTWTATQPMPVPMTDDDKTAVALRNDTGAGGAGAQFEDDGAQQVLAIGGCTLPPPPHIPSGVVQLFDAKTLTWSLRTPMPIPLCDGSAVLLKTGRVLVAGGTSPTQNGFPTYSNVAELYDVRTDTWTVAPPMNFARNEFTLTLLKDGRALAAGGHASFDTPQSTTELYDPKANAWIPAGTMSVRRAGLSATLLKDGNVLVAGGLFQPPTATRSADLFRVNSGQG